MSINIRGNLPVLSGTFLFKVITIEKKPEVVFELHYILLHCTMDGLDGCILKLVSRTGRRYQFLIAFFGGLGREESIDAPFSDECFNHLVHYVPLASTLKEAYGWSKTWKTCEAI